MTRHFNVLCVSHLKFCQFFVTCFVPLLRKANIVISNKTDLLYLKMIDEAVSLNSCCHGVY